VALLSIVVIGGLHSARLDLQVAKNHGDQIQAHYLALAGVEKAKALLYRDLGERKRSSKHHNGALFNAPDEFRDVSLGRGQFSVFHQERRDEGGRIAYGVSDEESRLNLNVAAADELAKLRGITPDVVAAVLDWRDGDNAVTPGGAEADAYAASQPPSLPRNGPLQTTRELLMVRGVSRELFLGEDANQNGLLDPEEDDGNESDPPDNRDGTLDAGWSGLVTVDSAVGNRNAAGQQRINITSADEKTLSAVPGISADLAKAIVAYRGQNQFESLAGLLDVTAVNPQNRSSTPPATPARPPGATPPPSARGPASPAAPAASQSSGPKLISEDLLMEIADDLSISSDDQPGAININTAGAEVLACLPGVTAELAQSIVAYRKSAGFYPNVAWLLKVDGMTAAIFKQLAQKVAARSETFRILSEGKVRSTGARKRIEVIVRLDSGQVATLSYREDL
jgi:competence ComEA-like helix-hairpin-helix protein